MKRLHRLSPFLLSLALLSTPVAAQDLPAETSAVLRARISGAAPELRLGGETWRASDQLACFYERRSFAPAWSGGRGLRPEADELLAALAAAREDGLRPEDYRTDPLRQLVDQLRRRPAAGSPAEVDLLLTDAFLTFGAHLLNGKVNPEALYADCSVNPEARDLATVLEEALGRGEVRTALADLAPVHPGYRSLREALRRYRDAVARETSLPPVAGPTLRPGDRDPRIRALRQHLTADARADGAPPVPPPAGDPEVFDPGLEEAVRAYQDRHGIVVDGIVGPSTLGKVQETPEQHVREIEINLERWRWLPRDPGERHILVNIAGFRLDAYEAGRHSLGMRVIVGKPATRTPIFSDRMEYIVLNPYWYVPQSIAQNELWPKQRRDPSYFRRNGFEVLSNGRLRQKAGPDNALGRLKLIFPNRYNVYLHDTPARSLFDRTVRSFSHGCIRVERPVDLAAWALNDPRWTPEALQAELDTRQRRQVPLAETLPVHIGYWTAWVDESGVLQGGRDIYKRDADLIDTLRL